MALNDLTGQRIKNTYNRLVQTEGGQYADGTGSILDIASSADIPSTSSLLITASAVENVLTFEKGDGSEFEVTIATGSLAGYATEAYVLSQTASLSASLAVDIASNTTAIGELETSASVLTTSASNALYTASVSSNIITFEKGDGSTFPITVDTGSAETVDTGSLLTTASAALNVVTFTKGDGSTFPITIDTGSAETIDTGSLLVTASISDATITLVKGDGSDFDLTVNNVLNANSAFVAITATNATNATNADNIRVQAVASANPFIALVEQVGDEPVEVDQNFKYTVATDTMNVRNILSDQGGITLQDGDVSVTGSLIASGGAHTLDGTSININSDSTIGLICDQDVRTSDLTILSGNDFDMEAGDATINGDATITGSLIVSGGNVTYGADDFTYTPTGGDEAAISVTGSLEITGSQTITGESTGSLVINDAEPCFTTYQSTTIFNNSNTNFQGWNSYSNFDASTTQYYTKWVAPFKCRVRFCGIFVQGNTTEVTMGAYINLSNGQSFTTNTPDHTFVLTQTGANQTHTWDWYYEDGETFTIEAGDTVDFALKSNGSVNANSCRLQMNFEKII